MDLNEDVVSKSRNAVDLSPQQNERARNYDKGNVVEGGKRRIQTDEELLNLIALAPASLLFSFIS